MSDRSSIEGIEGLAVRALGHRTAILAVIGQPRGHGHRLAEAHRLHDIRDNEHGTT